MLDNQVLYFVHVSPWQCMIEYYASSKMSIAGNVIGKLKNLVRPRWQRKLIETGLEDDCGNLTVDGRDVVSRMLTQKAYESDGKVAGVSLRQEIGEGLVKRDGEIKEENE